MQRIETGPLNFGAARLASAKARFTSWRASRKTSASGESPREISGGEVARRSNSRAGCALPLVDRRAAFSRVVASRSADKPWARFAEVSSRKWSAFSAVAEQRNRGDPFEIAHVGDRARAPECDQPGGWAGLDLKSSDYQAIQGQIGEVMMIDKAG